MTKHTATPWTYYAVGARLQIRNDIPRIVAVIELEQPFVTGNHETDVANARFIVHACNLHDELVEALENSTRILHDHAIRSGNIYGAIYQIDNNKAVLAKAEGKGEKP